MKVIKNNLEFKPITIEITTLSELISLTNLLERKEGDDISLFDQEFANELLRELG